jgi:hypothetical protein
MTAVDRPDGQELDIKRNFAWRKTRDWRRPENRGEYRRRFLNRNQQACAAIISDQHQDHQNDRRALHIKNHRA